MEIPTLDAHTLILYGSAILTMFATTFLRGFQNKNVSGGYKRLAAVFGYAMAVCDMLTIGLVVKGGLTVAFIGAIGAACGWVIGMLVHDSIMRKREKERAKAKKARKQTKREEMFSRIIEEKLRELDLIGE